MKKQQQIQVSESLRLATFLCLAGGFQDAYSYNCRGHVFANAQTGNIVLLGQALATADWSTALRYIYPLTAFVGGVYVTEWIRHLYKEGRFLHWRQIVLLAEIPMLIVAGLLPQQFNTLSNILMSFACAMQVNSFRNFRGISCATTMCIGNIRSGTECFCRYQITKDKNLLKNSGMFFYMILIFAVGAAFGGVITGIIGEIAIWSSAAFLAVGFLMMFRKHL